MKYSAFGFFLTLSVFFAFAITALAENKPLSWKMWDASVLLPLPKNLSEFSQMLSPQDTGKMGPFIPQNVLDSLPHLVGKSRNSEVFNRQLKVIGIRIDPCFQEGESPIQCLRQIRFVWQPVVQKKGLFTTEDAALHSFYTLSESEWSEFLHAYARLKLQQNQIGATSLQTHPLIRQQGLSGPYWLQLKKLLMNFTGNENLSRVTVMTIENSSDMWTFSGFEIKPEALEPIKIAKINTYQQSIMFSDLNSDDFIGTMTPIHFSELGLWFMDNSSESFKKFSETEFRSWTKELLQIENPRRHNPGTTDCVSCHLSANILSWQKKHFRNWDWKSIKKSEGFTSTQPLQNGTNLNLRPHHLRAFGYQDKKPRISDRVIHETALVLDWLKMPGHAE